MTDSTDYYDTRAAREHAADGASLLITAMRAGNCSNIEALVDEMGRRGTRNLHTFIAQCEAGEAQK